MGTTKVQILSGTLVSAGLQAAPASSWVTLTLSKLWKQMDGKGKYKPTQWQS